MHHVIYIIAQNKLVEIRKHGLRMELMNGGNTNAPDDPNAVDGGNGISSRYTSNNANDRGRHESEEWYRLCETRSQNYGMSIDYRFPSHTSSTMEKMNTNVVEFTLTLTLCVVFSLK